MSFLLQPRWIVGHVLVVALVVLFVRLGFWQLDRHGQHLDRNARIEARMQEPVRPLDEALREAGWREGSESVASDEAAVDDEALLYRRVEAAGRFDPEHEILLRNRSFQGRPGWHVLTPFVLDGGEAAILVDRGWVPQPFDSPPVEDASPPSGRVELQGVLLPEQDPPSGALAGLAARDPEEGVLERVFYVDVERLAAQVPYDLMPAFLLVTQSAPEAPGDLPVPPEPPRTEPAPHLGYALQWFAFAAIGVVGYALLLRHRWREERSP